ncbi:MAG: hypothetical protein LBU32_09565 [Clostridiales bacterium]|nr:hypothetical protein [Clostridiales bacterium]
MQATAKKRSTIIYILLLSLFLCGAASAIAVKAVESEEPVEPSPAEYADDVESYKDLWDSMVEVPMDPPAMFGTEDVGSAANEPDDSAGTDGSYGTSGENSQNHSEAPVLNGSPGESASYYTEAPAINKNLDNFINPNNPPPVQSIPADFSESPPETGAPEEAGANEIDNVVEVEVSEYEGISEDEAAPAEANTSPASLSATESAPASTAPPKAAPSAAQAKTPEPNEGQSDPLLFNLTPPDGSGGIFSHEMTSGFAALAGEPLFFESFGLEPESYETTAENTLNGNKLKLSSGDSLDAGLYAITISDATALNREDATITLAVFQPSLAVKTGDGAVETVIANEFGSMWYTVGSGEFIFSHGLKRGAYAAESYAPYKSKHSVQSSCIITLYWDEMRSVWAGSSAILDLASELDKNDYSPPYRYALPLPEHKGSSEFSGFSEEYINEAYSKLEAILSQSLEDSGVKL